MSSDLELTARNIRLTYAAWEIHTAREELTAAMDNGRTVTRAAAGISEVQLAQRLGVNRRTIRRWLGKETTR